MVGLHAFTDEQTRELVNLRQRYEVRRDAERAMRALPYEFERSLPPELEPVWARWRDSR